MGYKGLWYLRILAPDKRLYSSRPAGANRALYSHLEGTLKVSTHLPMDSDPKACPRTVWQFIRGYDQLWQQSAGDDMGTSMGAMGFDPLPRLWVCVKRGLWVIPAFPTREAGKLWV